MTKPTISQMVDELIASGMTGKSIAEYAKCDTSTISRIRRELITDPKHSIATAIESAYRERVKATA